MDRIWSVVLEGLLPMTVFVLLVASVLVVIRVRAGHTLAHATSVSTVEALLVGWITGLSLVTLGDWFGQGRQLDLLPMRSIWLYLTQWEGTTVPATQIMGNVLLFFPFGSLAPARWPRLRRLIATLGTAALLAIAVETLQFATDQGRVASTDDVILAVVGAGAGWLTFRVIAAIVESRAPARSLDIQSHESGKDPTSP